MPDKIEKFDTPRPTIMAVALALAEAEGMSVNQSFLREAEAAVTAAICHDSPDCKFFKGHDGICSPALEQISKDYELMKSVVGSIADGLPTSPVKELLTDLLA